ncbi:MAG: riboflavin synthase [Alphaproteobacteria bacterium]|nr:riboflavin synthase [Alphaproteobacteria bacterium]
MFTGIITDVGRIASIDDRNGREMTIETALPIKEIPIGGSIATSGICFTAVEKDDTWFSVIASGATLDVTTAGRWQVGDRVNLERSLRIGDELGGHIVFGHVDALGTLKALDAVAESHRLEIEIPANLAPLIAVKGSITVDGISLTVNEVEADRFVVNIIPHTFAETNLPDRKPGDLVNIEIDMLARYVARQMAFRSEHHS